MPNSFIDTTTHITTTKTVVSESKMERFQVHLTQNEIDFFVNAQQLKIRLYNPPKYNTILLTNLETNKLKKIWY